jgi:hypothetical protein
MTAPAAKQEKQEPASIEAPGLVFMAAYGDNREVRGMFDTPQQAHAFVGRLDSALKRGEIATAGGGLPGDHNGTRAALSSPPVQAAEPVRMLTHDAIQDTACNHGVWQVEARTWVFTEVEMTGYADAIQRAFIRINAGRTIPNKEK